MKTIKRKIEKLKRAIKDLESIEVDINIISPLKTMVKDYETLLNDKEAYIIIETFETYGPYPRFCFRVIFNGLSKQLGLSKWRGMYATSETRENNISRLDFSSVDEKDLFHSIEDCERFINKKNSVYDNDNSKYQIRKITIKTN